MRQIKLIITLIFLVLSQLVIGQDFVESWVGHFSYLDIKDVSQGSFKVFGAAENAIFIYDKQSK